MTDDKDGFHSSYYDIPKEATDIVDLINHKNMNHSVGEAFCALYRLYDKDTPIRNLEKVIYYIEREKTRLQTQKGEN